MQVGSELFDVSSMPLTDHNHLFIRQGTGLQGQAVFRQKLTFRPISTHSLTHKRVMTRLQQRVMTQTNQVKLYNAQTDKNPEIEGYKRAKEQEKDFKMKMKKQQMLARQSMRKMGKGSSAGSGNQMTLEFMKSKAGNNKRYGNIYSDDDSSSESEDSIDAKDLKKKKGSKEGKRKNVNLDSTSEEEAEETESSLDSDDSEAPGDKEKQKKVRELLDSDSD